MIAQKNSMKKSDPPVCVVDDDPSIREAIEGLLRAEGIRVENRSAKEFLTRGRLEPPGCLVLDVGLPGLSGLNFSASYSGRISTFPLFFLPVTATSPRPSRHQGGCARGSDQASRSGRFARCGAGRNASPRIRRLSRIGSLLHSDEIWAPAPPTGRCSRESRWSRRPIRPC